MTDKTLQDRLRDPSHGFDRNDSHTEDRYVCLCEHLANEAADAIDAQAERIKALEGDAERYRWLRDEYWDFNVDTHGIWDSDSTQLDATIDRARALLGE